MTAVVCKPNAILNIAMFCNGQLKQDRSNHIKFACYRNYSRINDFGLTQRILVVETPTRQYTGTNFESWVAQKTKMYQYLVGIYDVRTRSIVLYPTNVFDCKFSIDCIPKPIKTQDSETYTEKVNNLVQEFGSKRRKKAVESRNFESGTLALSSVVDDMKGFCAEMLQSDKKTKTEDIPSSSGSTIPPQNKMAVSPEEVYCLNDIISQEEYDALYSKAMTLKEASLEDIKRWKTSSEFCFYIISHLENSLNQLSLHKAKLLYYLHFLMVLVKLEFKDLKHSDPMQFIGQPFKRYLQDKFFIGGSQTYEKSKRMMSYQMKDKVMAYALVLALHIDNFSVNAHELQQDFKVPMSKITKLASALGCRTSSRKFGAISVPFVNLKLPLFDPNEKFKKKGI